MTSRHYMGFSKKKIKILYLKGMFIEHSRIRGWKPQGPSIAEKAKACIHLQVPGDHSSLASQTLLLEPAFKMPSSIQFYVCFDCKMVSSNTDCPQTCRVAKDYPEFLLLLIQLRRAETTDEWCSPLTLSCFLHSPGGLGCLDCPPGLTLDDPDLITQPDFFSSLNLCIQSMLTLISPTNQMW